MKTIQRQYLLAALAIGFLLISPASVRAAADIDFRPAVQVGYERDGNVQVVGVEETDEVIRILFDLTLEARTPNTTFQAAYRPYREDYSDFSQFDNTGHLLSMELSHAVSRRSDVEFRLDGSRTDSQFAAAEDPALIRPFVARTTVDRLGFDLSGRAAGGARSFFTWGVDAAVNRYDEIQGSEISFEDSEDYGVSFGWEYETSPRSTLGFAAEAGKVSFETLDDTDVMGLYLTGTKEFSRVLAGEFSVGALRAEADGESTSDFGLDARLDREVADIGTLSAGVRQSVTSGLGVGGATLDRGGYLAWTRTWQGRIAATVNLSYWDREGLDLPGVTGISSNTLASSESLQWSPTPRLSLGVNHRYVDQDLPGAEADTDYHSGGIFIRWAFNPRRNES